MRKLILLLIFIAPLAKAQTNTFCANNLPCATTGNNTHSGTETFSGVVTQKCLNASAICFADQFAGADASIKVNACIAAAIALGGGTCDARALVGAQVISQQINVGNPVGSGNTPIVLLMPPYGIWTPTGITDGVSYAIKVWSGSAAIGTGSTISANFLTIGGSMANTINMGALCGTDTTETSNYIRMEGFKCGITSGTATMAKAVSVFYSMPDGGTVSKMGFYNLTSPNATKVFWVYASNDGNFTDLSVDAFNETGVTPCWFGNGAVIGNLSIKVDGIGCNHPGSGASALVDQEYANFNGNVFKDVYIEENRTGGVPDLTTPTISVQAFSTVLSADLFIGITMQGDIASSTRYTADIASGAKAIFSNLHQGGVSTNAINDHNGSGLTLTAANYTTFSYETETHYFTGNLAPYNMVTFNASNTVTSTPPVPAANNLGWKYCLYGNVYCVALEGSDEYHYIPNWLSVGASLPAGSGTATTPDVNAITSIGSNGLVEKEIAAPSAAGAGFDQCYGDSTAHGLKCSYNNGSFLAVPQTIASGTKALNTASITTATCDAGTAATATGTASTDTVDWSFNAAPTATNKYGAFLVVYAVPSTNTVTFYTCNPSATTSTPTAMTVNFSVRRP